MNRRYYQRLVDQCIQKDYDATLLAVNSEMVLTNEAAEDVGKGLLALKNMNQSDMEKIKSMSVDQILESWTGGEGEKDGGKSVRAAIAYLDKSLGVVNDAMLGRLHTNEVGAKIVNKFYHSESSDNMTGTLNLQTRISASNMAGFDVGWMQTYRMVPAEGFNEVKVHDLVTALRFQQYKDGTDKPVVSALGSHSAETVNRKFFGAGFKWNAQEMSFSVWNINQVLSQFRENAVKITARNAYREIARFVSGTTPTYGGTTDFSSGGTSAIEKRQHLVWHIRTLLNNAHYQMIRVANQTQTGKKKVKSTEAPLDVSATTPLLLYYNTQHFDIMEAVQRVGMGQIGQEGLNPINLKNWVFIETDLIPPCAAWTIAGEETDDRDPFGFYGATTDHKDETYLGAVGIIPGFKNLYTNFRNLAILNDTDSIEETAVMAAKTWFNHSLSTRQKGWIDIGKPW